MKFTAALLITLGSFLVATPTLADNGDKVVICHAAGRAGTTHFETIEVARPAAFGPGGHFNENGTTQAGHEQDYLGPCQTPTTTTEVVDTTSTTTDPTSTTSTTSLAPTSTVSEATTTSSPSETTVTSTTLPATTSSVAVTTPVVPATTLAQPVTETRRLPETGDNTGHLAIAALGLILIGGGATALARRR